MKSRFTSLPSRARRSTGFLSARTETTVDGPRPSRPRTGARRERRAQAVGGAAWQRRAARDPALDAHRRARARAVRAGRARPRRGARRASPPADGAGRARRRARGGAGRAGGRERRGGRSRARGGRAGTAPAADSASREPGEPEPRRSRGRRRVGVGVGSDRTRRGRRGARGHARRHLLRGARRDRLERSGRRRTRGRRRWSPARAAGPKRAEGSRGVGAACGGAGARDGAGRGVRPEVRTSALRTRSISARMASPPGAGGRARREGVGLRLDRRRGRCSRRARAGRAPRPARRSSGSRGGAAPPRRG